jgi:uncharacterized membrane protein YcaP (DUF421 family)
LRWQSAPFFRETTVDKLFSIDWWELVIPTHSLAEMAVRGTVMYFALFIVLRLLLKRQTGGIGLADLLLVVIIADAAQNAFSKDYGSLSEGIVLVLTIVFWDYVLDWLGYRLKWLRAIIHPAPLLLIRDGRLLKANLRKEAISEDELMSQLREKGIETVSKVKRAYIEGDGHISVIEK